MKKQLLLFMAFVCLAYYARAQCTSSGLVFSSYLEGASTEACVEIYNGTGADVDLSMYTIEIFYDGSSTAGSSIPLGAATLADQATYRICDDECTLPYCGGADLLSSAMSFDGNDALQLSLNGVPEDCFGVVGDNPGVDWGSAPCSSSGHLLIRDIITPATCSGTCFSSFEPFLWVGSDAGNCIPIVNLPVKLTQFQARKADNGDVLINWITESEENLSKFIVQHSFEGDKFEDIVVMPAKGNDSSFEQHYDATHLQPRSGTHYYRLKMIDFDGSFTFSDVRSVEIIVRGIAISPNPAGQFLQVDFNEIVSDVDLQVMDISGKLLIEVNTGAKQSGIKIDLSELSGGHYFIRTIAKSTINVFRFVKI